MDTIEPIIDVTEAAKKYISPKVVKAERKGKNVLVLIRLLQPNGITFDPAYRQAQWQLEYRWLSRLTGTDDEICNVQGNEHSYHGRRTVARCVRKRNPVHLFDAFQLF